MAERKFVFCVKKNGGWEGYSTLFLGGRGRGLNGILLIFPPRVEFLKLKRYHLCPLIIEEFCCKTNQRRHLICFRKYEKNSLNE